MPSRNVIKEYVSDSYYHIYNRGVNKQDIFREPSDYVVFQSLLKRYLSEEPQTDKNARQYPHYKNEVDLLAFCLMPNHFHLLIFQKDDKQAITKLLRSISTTYTMYFNKKYARIGPLSQSNFKASRISSDEYLQHISRYIHLNPDDYKTYEWSSLPYYMGKKQAEWIDPSKILDLFDEVGEYTTFLSDYADYKDSLEEIKYELANNL